MTKKLISKVVLEEVWGTTKEFATGYAYNSTIIDNLFKELGLATS